MGDTKKSEYFIRYYQFFIECVRIYLDIRHLDTGLLRFAMAMKGVGSIIPLAMAMKGVGSIIPLVSTTGILIGHAYNTHK